MHLPPGCVITRHVLLEEHERALEVIGMDGRGYQGAEVVTVSNASRVRPDPRSTALPTRRDFHTMNRFEALRSNAGRRGRQSTGASRARRVIGGAAVVSAVALAALTPTAQAAPQAQCPANALCLYSAAGLTGDQLALASPSGSGTCVDLAAQGWAGRVKSVLNTHSTSAALFPNENCLGGPYRVEAGAGVRDLGAFAPLSVWMPGRTTT
ncbi:peptidase inhibitor family I36 protein [Streptomyces sp. NPDC033538]|uniref:peptidase inhibitor family I36 protein n=1 Tax=Streptomyces sp. NPDC033538 TaxID=3155367 RepID=UPI0033C19BF2